MTLMDRFKIWYAKYPRKEAPGNAERAWLKIKPDDALLQIMLAALDWQVKSPQWTKEGGTFIPLPASYLNAKRWLDEPMRRPAKPKPTGKSREDQEKFDEAYRWASGQPDSKLRAMRGDGPPYTQMHLAIDRVLAERKVGKCNVSS